jgi:glycosyltransferase involved in cell wall biosynthesis
VLLIVNALIPGGAEIQLMHLAMGLAKSGHDITLCCVNGTFVDLEPLQQTGVKVVSLHAQKRLQRIAALPRLIRLARRAEIVHCTIWDASLWGRIAAIVARRPVIVADHATDRSIHTSANGASRASWVATHNRVLDPFTYATVACATTQRQVLLSEGVAAGKIVYIPNGLPIAHLLEVAAATPGRAALGIAADVPVIMQVGVFRKEKNQIGALEAVAGVRASGTDAQLVFVGDGPIMPAVAKRAAELEADWVHFLGYRSDVPALLTLADVMLQPSNADAMPMTVLEAMALGVPVVATDVGDVAAMLEDRAGICVPPNDRQALERACVELLGDDQRRAAMGLAGKEIASAFDSSVMVHSYELLFQAAYEGTAPTAALPPGDVDRATPVAT